MPGPRIGLGCATLVRAGVSEDAAAGIVQEALRRGVTEFDTAAFYGGGRSERLLGEVLGPARGQVTITTKGGVSYPDLPDLGRSVRDCSYPALRRDLEGSLARLRTDHVDVYLLHQFDPALSPEVQLEALARLRDEGLAREVGFCNFGPNACRRALSTGIPDRVEYSFSLIDHRYAGELAAAAAGGCTRVTFGTFAHGLLAEDLAEEPVFAPDDWRHTSRRSGDAPTSGNEMFAGERFTAFREAAGRLRKLGANLGIGLATLAAAAVLSGDHSDVVLAGCRTTGELEDALLAEQTRLTPDHLERIAAAVAPAEPLRTNRLDDAR